MDSGKKLALFEKLKADFEKQLFECRQDIERSVPATKYFLNLYEICRSVGRSVTVLNAFS